MGMTETIDEDFHAQKHFVMAQLAQIRDELCEQITNELDSIMLQVQQLAIEYCPKDTGALASSISLSGGAISAGSNFYEASISAGDPNILNPISGQPTALYALFVHDGHALPNGMFYEGVPFLADAMAAFEAGWRASETVNSERVTQLEKALTRITRCDPYPDLSSHKYYDAMRYIRKVIADINLPVLNYHNCECRSCCGATRPIGCVCGAGETEK